ncbi:MAG: hypothetical protein ACI84B_001294 [Oceanospirillaceae bacterium]
MLFFQDAEDLAHSQTSEHEALTELDDVNVMIDWHAI